jgi:hypothetical protein
MDIYYSWVEGARILQGQNPYARVLQGDMRENDKYATYFPLFYLLSASSQAAGLTSFGEWIRFWRLVFIAFHLATGFLLFAVFIRRQQPLLGLLLASLWLLHNWGLRLSNIAHFDFIPIFFLVLSLLLFNVRRYASLFALSLSLALKQIAIFLVPLYLIWVWQQEMESRARQVFVSGFIIASVPILSSIPFIAWEVEGFILSVLFSVTRYAQFRSVGVFLFGSGGIVNRIPLFLGGALVYLLALRGQLGRYNAAMLVMLVFISFTPVLFPQYLPWAFALILLSFYSDG